MRDRVGLYAIVDPARAGARGPEALADAILRGGCAVLQLRAKALPGRARLALAERLARRARDAGVAFVVNDHVDVACLVGADGLHLGQDDLPIGAARRLFHGAIGVSTHSPEELARALAEGADAVGFGPVFGTRSKARVDPVVGLEGLTEACRRSTVPVVAIGGLGPEHAAAAARAGAPLVAAIAALADAAEPEQAARAMHAAVRGVWSR